MRRRAATHIVLLATVIWGLLGVYGIVSTMFLVMWFDAPASTGQVGTIALAIGVISVPITCASSILFSWAALWNDAMRSALLWLLLPFVSIATCTAAQAWIDHYQNGRLGG